jgi:ubiquinone/menaquinone biosynthesis C-methylase UbiE
VIKLAQWVGSRFAERQYVQAVQSLRIGKPKTILDVGGSSGLLARKILAHVGQCEYHVLEIDQASVKQGHALNPSLHYTRADVEACPFGAQMFDLVICKDVLHHCANPGKAVAEIRVLLTGV